MSHLNIWIHAVWATKNRKPLLNAAIRRVVFRHMKEHAIAKSIHLDFVNGYTDHVHCLISLKPDQCISKLMQLIKGESSYWVNQNKLTTEKFEWQSDYFAVSVGASSVNRVREYIRKQESHHAKKGFQQEYEELLQQHGFDD